MKIGKNGHLRLVGAPENPSKRATALELTGAVGVAILLVGGAVALLCLAIEYGAEARSFIVSTGHAAAGLIRNFWVGIGVCTFSLGGVLWAGVLTAALGDDDHRGWRVARKAAMCVGSVVWIIGGQALLDLIGEDAGAARWIAMLATHGIGLLATGLGWGLAAGFVVFDEGDRSSNPDGGAR
jgi:hypothetical protein